MTEPNITRVTTLASLSDAERGSYYTILGAGGDLDEWVVGYERLLVEQGIGRPVTWYSTTGAAVNAFTRPTDPRDRFADDLTILLFPLDGLNVGALAMFKLAMTDRWFDDVVANIRTRNDEVVDHE